MRELRYNAKRAKEIKKQRNGNNEQEGKNLHFVPAKKSHVNVDQYRLACKWLYGSYLTVGGTAEHSYLPTTTLRLQNIAQMSKSLLSALTCNERNKQ